MVGSPRRIIPPRLPRYPCPLRAAAQPLAPHRVRLFPAPQILSSLQRVHYQLALKVKAEPPMPCHGLLFYKLARLVQSRAVYLSNCRGSFQRGQAGLPKSLGSIGRVVRRGQNACAIVFGYLHATGGQDPFLQRGRADAGARSRAGPEPLLRNDCSTRSSPTTIWPSIAITAELDSLPVVFDPSADDSEGIQIVGQAAMGGIDFECCHIGSILDTASPIDYAVAFGINQSFRKLRCLCGMHTADRRQSTGTTMPHLMKALGHESQHFDA
jgi:hypothetical protein